mmetsp:Transcript_106990/g.255364  ORF Transcript_106990/g.255364 Transcript_106990/m.255364 type:complete len:262 (-) Transcript_106990:159-944(-)
MCLDQQANDTCTNKSSRTSVIRLVISLELAKHSGGQAVPLVRIPGGCAPVVSKAAAPTAGAEEHATQGPSGLLLLKEDLRPRAPADLPRLHRFRGLDAVLRLDGHERRLAGVVLPRSGVATARRSTNHFHPALQKGILRSHSRAGPKLDLCTVEGVIALYCQTHVGILLGSDLALRRHAPPLILVGFIAFPEVDLGAVHVLVAVDDHAVRRISSAPEPARLVQMKVLAHTRPAAVTVPEVQLDAVADVPVAGQAEAGRRAV